MSVRAVRQDAGDSKIIIIAIVCGIAGLAVLSLIIGMYYYYSRHILHELPPGTDEAWFCFSLVF
jgi:hypothetical protein